MCWRHIFTLILFQAIRKLPNVQAPLLFMGPMHGLHTQFIWQAVNEAIAFGSFYLKVLHTPGHSIESTCYVLYDENHKPVVFSQTRLFAVM